MSVDEALSKELESFLDNTGMESKPEPEPAPDPKPVAVAPVKPEAPAAVVAAPEPIVESILEPEPVVAEPAVVTEPADVEVPLTDREKLLMARLEEVTKQSLEAGMDAPVAPASPVVPPVVAPAVVPKPAVAPEPMNFIGDDKLDDILDSPEKFNAVLASVYNKGMEAAQRGAVDEILKSIPKLITGYIGRHTTMTAMVDDFYKENADLLGVKRTVAAVANEVAAEEPGLAVDKVFEKTAERTRKVLGMQAKVANMPIAPTVPAAPIVPVQGNTPAFVSQGSRKAPSAKLKGLAADINDLIMD